MIISSSEKKLTGQKSGRILEKECNRLHMATMHDVAQRAGVSVATVSRFFNGGYTSPASRASIEKAVEELQYSPNSIAKALSAHSSRLVGLVVPSVTNPFFPELARAVEEETARKGYQLILCNSEGSIEKEQRFIEAMTSHFADGIITSTGNCGEVYKASGMPVVSVDRELGTGAPHVTSDNYRGGMLAFKCLAEKACKKFAFIGAPQESTSQRHRREGFFHEAERQGYAAPEIFLADEADEYRALEDEGEHLSRYDGIFAWNDHAAVQAIRALHQVGRSVPRDVMVIGFDDVHIARLYIPSLTTIAQPIYEMGRAAAELLMRQMNGEKLDNVTYLLGVELISRETTAVSANLRVFQHADAF